MRPFAFGIFLLALTGWLGAAEAQSFNCARASFADEHAICQSPGLSHLDNALAAVFGRAMSATPPGQRAALKGREDEWVVSRRRCGRDDACIEQAYRDRMASLSALAGSPEPRSPLPAAAGNTGRQGSASEAPHDMVQQGVTVQFR